jgi:hypothetical protein
MRIRHLVCIGALLVLTACGGSSSSDDSDKPEAKKTPAATTSTPALSEADAKKALLTLEDMSEGWQVDPDDGSDAGIKLTKGSKACKKLAGGAGDEAPTKVESSFASGEQRFLSSSVESYDSADAEKEWTADLEGFRACHEFTLGASDGVSIDVKVEPAPISDLGDESAAFRATGTLQGITLHMIFMGVRDGQNVAAVSALSFDEEAPRDRLETLMQVMLDRLDKLEGAA